MTQDQSSGREALPLVPEALASALTDRINHRRGLPEFRESAVVPQADPSNVESEIRRRSEPLLFEVQQTRQTLEQLQQHLRRLKRKLNPLFFGTAALSTAAFIFAVIELLVSRKSAIYLGRYYHPLESRGRIVAILLIALMALGISVYAWRWLRRESQTARRIGEIDKRALTLRQELETRLDFEIDRLLRLDANERGERTGVLVLTPQAPDLVELETAEPTDTPDISRLRELVVNASTSAFAIAGPRGIGKTTLIRALTSDRKLFSVAAVVPAPVHYDPDALLRRIYSDLARAILTRYGAEDVLVELQQSVEQRIRSRRLGMAALALATGFVLVILDMLNLPFLYNIGFAGTTGILLAFVAYIAIMSLGNRRTPRSDIKSDVVQNAVDALEALRWSTEATQASKSSFSAAKIFVGLEDTDSSTRKERDWSRPERVADLTSFLRRHLTLARSMDDQSDVRRIAIAVDELDKISDSKEILETVNSLKDLFRIPDVHFLVSVSNDAMTRFALRGVVSRDAFDSSFDAVIELHRLTAEEAHEILSGRAIGFPRSLSAISHAWSGGLPRDLIRVARRCVELRRNTETTSIDRLAASIIAEDIAQAFVALRITDNANADSRGSAPSRLTPLIVDLTRYRGALFTTSELGELLRQHANICRDLDPSIRPAVTKLLVSAALTLSFAAGLAQGDNTADAGETFALANGLAKVNALQNEPLGEVLAAAQETLEHMRRVRIPVMVDLSLLVNATTPTTQQTPEPSTASRS
jgi:Cdc6-like AAA superfamily ATPase